MLVFESKRNPGHPILDPKKGFKEALKDAEIENFRFHDLRYTAGTRLAEANVDAFTIKDILGQPAFRHQLSGQRVPLVIKYKYPGKYPGSSGGHPASCSQRVTEARSPLL